MAAMFLALALALAADPPPGAKAAAKPNPTATARKVEGLAMVNLGPRASFVGPPKEGLDALLAVATQSAVANLPGAALKDWQFTPILAHGDAAAPSRLLCRVSMTVEDGSTVLAEPALQAVCKELGAVLRDANESEYLQAAKARAALESDIERLTALEQDFAGKLDPTLRGSSSDEAEKAIADKARAREAAERGLLTARARLETVRKQAAETARAKTALAGERAANAQLAQAKAQLETLRQTFGAASPRIREQEAAIKALEAELDQVRSRAPNAAGLDLGPLALEAQMREAEAELALRHSDDDARLASLRKQLDLLRERDSVRRRRAALEDEFQRQRRIEAPDSGVTLLRVYVPR